MNSINNIFYRNKKLLYINLIFLALFLIQSILIIYKIYNITFAAKQWTYNITKDSAEDLTNKFNKVPEIISELKNYINQKPLNKQNIDKSLKKTLFNARDFDNIGIIFDPYLVDKKIRLYAPFSSKKQGFINDISNYYDYLTLDADKFSYHKILKEGEAKWLDPQYDQVSQNFILRYISPAKFINSQDYNALLFFDLSLNWLKNEMEKTNIGDNNYLEIVNENGQILYHSLKSQNNIESEISQTHKYDFKALEQGKFLFKNQLSDYFSWQYGAKISGTNLWLIATSSISELNSNQELIKNIKMISTMDWISWIILLTLLVICFYLYYFENRTRNHIFIICAILLFGTALLIRQHIYSFPSSKNHSLILANKNSIESFQRDYIINSFENKIEIPKFIPTEIFINSVNFKDISNVNITGYLKQQYHKLYHKDISKDFIFTNAIAVDIEKVQEEQKGQYLTKTWFFQALFGQNLSYNKFPLDQHLVSIKISHPNLEKNIILTPNFSSYTTLASKTLPAIDNDLSAKTWNIHKSYYSMEFYNDRNHFQESKIYYEKSPELFFNLELKRKFFSSLISYIFPLGSVLIILYITIIIFLRHFYESGEIPMGAIQAYTALFFTVSFTHIDLREDLEVNNLFYLEYFYWIAYLFILTSALLILHIKKKANSHLLWGKIITLSYWPMLFTSIFLITALCLF